MKFMADKQNNFNSDKTFGGRLRNLRKNKGLSQIDLSKLLNYKTSASVSNIESEKTPPDIHFLVKIAEIFKADLHWLITGNPAPYSEQQDKNYQRIFADLGKHISWSIAFLLEERDKREIEISKLEKKGDRLNLDLIKVINDEADNIQQHLSELVKLQPEIQKILTDLLTPKNTKKP